MNFPTLSKRQVLLGGLLLCASLSYSQSKNYYSMSLEAGNTFFYGERSNKSEPANRPNLAILPQVSYHFNNQFRVNGNVGIGIISGTDDVLNFQSTYVEPSLSLSYNLLTLFNKQTRYAFEIEGGLGWMSFYTEVFNASKQLVTTVPNEGTMSQSAFGLYGAKFRLPVSKNVSANIGYANRYVVDNDWMDGLPSENENDSYGTLSVGITFNFSNTIKNDEKAIKKTELKSILSKNDELEEELKAEKAKSSEVIKEKESRIADLQSHIDSLKSARVVSSPAEAEEINQINANQNLTAKYHCILGSFSSLQNAKSFIEKDFKGESDQIDIVYMEDKKLYRVVYIGRLDYQTAKKDVVRFFAKAPDAWIAQF